MIDHNSEKNQIDEMRNILKKSDISFEIQNLEFKKFSSQIHSINEENKEVTQNQMSNMSNIHQSLFLSKQKSEDLTYFVEDDYIHETISLSEILYTYEKIASLTKQELIICPTDYPYLYQQDFRSNILIGKEKYWRTVDQTLCTYLISKDLLINYWEKYIEMATNNYDPYEKPLHFIYNERICLSPIPSLSIHLANLNTVYGLSPLIDWKDIWEKSKVTF